MGKKNSLLWKFHLPGKSKTHYLLGTMHVSSSEAYSYVALAQHYMDQCMIYAGELDLNDPGLSDISNIFMGGQDVKLLIGEKKYKKAKNQILKAFNIDLDSISAYKPIVITNMIGESLLTKEYDLALDHFLWEYAQAKNMKMYGLESAEDQAYIMQNIPLDYQIKAFKSMVSNVSKFRKDALKLAEYYASGDLQKLYKSARKSMGGLRKLMIYDRNAIMADKILEKVDEGTVFAAIGAAHLSGKKGVLKLLKDVGYKVKPIT